MPVCFCCGSYRYLWAHSSHRCSSSICSSPRISVMCKVAALVTLLALHRRGSPLIGQAGCDSSAILTGGGRLSSRSGTASRDASATGVRIGGNASPVADAPDSPLPLVPFAARRYHPTFMKPHEPPPNGALPSRAWRSSPVVAGVRSPSLAAQAWMTLGLFGPGHTTDRLLDDEPILSGRHPLHLYHGLLGARSFLSRGTLSCYDPAFQAGYPKTPVFDDGSRPAEIAAGRWRAGATCRASTSWAWPGCACWRRACSPGRRAGRG